MSNAKIDAAVAVIDVSRTKEDDEWDVVLCGEPLCLAISEEDADRVARQIKNGLAKFQAEH